jgi:transcriptional accessory protein Tex/SPT6
MMIDDAQIDALARETGLEPLAHRPAESLARSLGLPLAALIGNRPTLQSIDPWRYVSEEAGLPILQDILAELEKPGRDPHEQFRQCWRWTSSGGGSPCPCGKPRRPDEIARRTGLT